MIENARLKIIRIDARDMMQAVYGMKKTGWRVEGCSCLPAGCTVHSVHQNWRVSPECFEIVAFHPSFEEVPLDRELPVLRCECRLNVVEVLPKPRGLIRLESGKFRFAEPHEKPEFELVDGPDESQPVILGPGQFTMGGLLGHVAQLAHERGLTAKKGS